MGRGRAKAKQTKVARQLKYSSGGTDLSRLAEELGASPSNESQHGDQFKDGDELDDELDNDPYARYAEMYGDDSDDEDEDDQGSGRSQGSSGSSGASKRRST
ncbi:DUF3073 domain-containing protein [Streptomyces sp. XM4011]|uniref:DUF3073 domain-containing protein n=1 Tax=Streptomyces sp. XM4011 TaxID=2929780 RepID=UPI001FFAAADE|nr:DUF3073 domain-containing protein [Streptomyces sp. XM4011]MCK1814446.1 DUF3073 domain-containing protein [Streptomyces sp. XM4011]